VGTVCLRLRSNGYPNEALVSLFQRPSIYLGSLPARLPNRQRYHSVAQQQQDASTDMPTNLWQPGVSGNPAGRKPGSRNRLSEAVICALLRDFSKHGEKAIAKVRRTQPAAYLKICAWLVPRENKVEHSRSVSELSDQQLNAMIEVLSSRLESRAAGIDVPPLIDVTPDGEVIALPVPDQPKQRRKRPNPIADYQSVMDDPNYKGRRRYNKSRK
jgi:hypothetical protein